MKAFLRVFRQKPGNFGEAPMLAATFIGTGGRLAVASSTVSAQVAKGSGRLAVTKVAISGFTAAVGSGAITAQLFKVVGGNGGTRTALTAAFDLTSGGITTLDKWLVIPITGTDVQCLVQDVDALTLDLVCAGTISTQLQAAVVVNVAKA